MNPIPSFQGYNFISNYYYLLKKDINYNIKNTNIQKKNIEDYDEINKSLSSLKYLDCSFNRITILENLPDTISVIDCDYNVYYLNKYMSMYVTV